MAASLRSISRTGTVRAGASDVPRQAVFTGLPEPSTTTTRFGESVWGNAANETSNKQVSRNPGRPLEFMHSPNNSSVDIHNFYFYTRSRPLPVSHNNSLRLPS